jgi:hypothetical protein
MALFKPSEAVVPGALPGDNIVVTIGGELELTNDEANNFVAAPNVTEFLTRLLTAAGVAPQIVIPATVAMQAARFQIEIMNRAGGNNGVRVIFLLTGGGPIVLPNAPII